jgi:abhydrolase domain-containing protein 17
LYKFERYVDGKLVGQEEEENANNESENGVTPSSTNSSKNNNIHKSGQEPSTTKTTVEIVDDSRNNHEAKDPAVLLTEKAMRLRKVANVKNARDAKDAERGVQYKFIPDPRLAQPPRFSGHVDAVKIGPHPKTKNYVAALIYRQDESKLTDNTKTIIYSHGNATDVGAMYFMQVLIAKGLKCNVVSYDYSGYGESGGVPLEENTYRDIEMVYDYVLENVAQGKEERNIIVYGQSVGSGPSCYIACKRPDVGGLILHSPFMSGMRVLTSSRALACLDIFPNINRIKKVQCPVMVIHGLLDEEVHFSHGKSLHDAVPDDLKREPWWVKDRGHNDITADRSKVLEYMQRLKIFFDGLDETNQTE